MLTYLLIALGGAIGSVARAWLGTAIASLTGPSFPWGTILINVVGSFVIGFFGTLTATDGRFALPFDARAFVMVGLCGGFTTFSSFSLQTLELARDGRGGQALGNIALSVTLCLASVAAGYSLALAVRTSRLAVIGDASPGSMGRSTLVVLHQSDAVSRMLEIAARLMDRKGGRITALAVDGPVLAALQPTEEVQTRERAQEIAAHRSDWTRSMKPVLDQWVATEREAGHPARWIEVHGDGAVAVAEHGRSAHLLLLEQWPGDDTARARVHSALIRSRRPVLLVPSATMAGFGRVIAVAWQDDPHVHQAIRFASPLLSKADRVVVLRIGEQPDGDAALAQAFEGMQIEVVTRPANGETTGTQLLAMAHEAGADLLVMGGDARSRLRERLFDSATEEVLRLADLPVLMGHHTA